MKEKVLNNKKNGMAMLLLFGLLYTAAVGLTVLGGIGMDNHRLWAIPVFVVGVIWICVGWMPPGRRSSLPDLARKIWTPRISCPMRAKTRSPRTTWVTRSKRTISTIPTPTKIPMMSSWSRTTTCCSRRKRAANTTISAWTMNSELRLTRHAPLSGPKNRMAARLSRFIYRRYTADGTQCV